MDRAIENEVCAVTTLLYEPDGGFYLLHRHIERLRSAHAHCRTESLEVDGDVPVLLESQVMEELLRAVELAGAGTPQRVRVVVDREGHATASSAPMSGSVMGCVTLCLDTQPTSCQNSGHKTTSRSFYDDARARVGAGLDSASSTGEPFDVLMWNCAGFITETSIANIAFELPTSDAHLPKFVTPRAKSGLIKGVMRQELLDTGFLVEGDVLLEDAIRAAQMGRRIIAFNALRKIFEVRLITSPERTRPAPKTLPSMGVGVIIDCYDSYTNNLLPLLNTAELSPRDFEKYLEENVAVIRLHTIQWSTFRDQVLPQLDWIILSPGPGRPDNTKDFGFCAELLRFSCLPILGVCLGHQGLGFAYGGHVEASREAIHGRTVHIHNTGLGIFHGVPSTDMVRYNSLCVDVESLPRDVEVTAWTRSGEGQAIEIMGLQHRYKPHFGVQFHLESTCSDHRAAQQLMKCFANVVVDFRRKKTSPSQLPDLCKTISYIDFSKLRPTNPLLPEPRKNMRVITQKIHLSLSPVAVYGHLLRTCEDKNEGDTFWLDSARSSTSDPLSRFSYLGTTDRCFRYEDGEVRLSVRQDDVCLVKAFEDGQTFWDWLQDLQLTIRRSITADGSFCADFQCGLMGYLGYELGRDSLDGYRPRTNNLVNSGTPAEFMILDKVLVFDHVSSSWYAVGVIRSHEEATVSELEEKLRCRFGVSEDEFQYWTQALESGVYNEIETPHQHDGLPREFQFSHTRESYWGTIDRLKRYIGEGESYEMNLTGQFTGTLPSALTNLEAYHLYSDIRARNPAGHSALFSFAKTRTHILSTSPELFVRLSGEDGRAALMKPIKGTLRRSPCRCDPCMDPQNCEADRIAADKQRLEAFVSDPKERAENLMIVDLIKADLQNFCHTSSVRVQKLMDVEASETVYSLVTSVEGTLVQDVGPVEAIRRSFPPGSMTGAPKLRSVELLENLEQQQPRGIYSGCLGYISVDNKASFNVVIRTLVIKDRTATVGAGGAITWLSEAHKEWDEVLLKARSVLQDRV